MPVPAPKPAPDIPTIQAAIRNGNVEAVKHHLDKGAPLDWLEGYPNMPPLMYAVNFGQKEVARLLLERGAKVNQKNPSGETALNMSINIESPAIVRLLLEWGGDVNMKNNLGRSPMDKAMLRRDEGMVKLLKSAPELLRHGPGGELVRSAEIAERQRLLKEKAAGIPKLSPRPRKPGGP